MSNSKMSFRKFMREKHSQEPWRKRFDETKHPAECAKFKLFGSVTAEEAHVISLACKTCQNATKKKHLPGCDKSARNEEAWSKKRKADNEKRAAKKAKASAGESGEICDLADRLSLLRCFCSGS